MQHGPQQKIIQVAIPRIERVPKVSASAMKVCPEVE